VIKRQEARLFAAWRFASLAWVGLFFAVLMVATDAQAQGDVAPREARPNGTAIGRTRVMRGWAWM